MTTNKYIVLNDTAYFNVSGTDKDRFLQGLITNDINKCSKNNAIYSAFLSPQGKFIADFFIINQGKSYLFETRKQLIEELIKKLNIYKLRANVQISKIDKYISVAIHARTNFFNTLNLPGQLIESENSFIFVDPREKEMGIRIITKKNDVNKFIKKYNLYEDSFNNYNQKRLEYTIPDSLLDLKVNKSVLLENNFDAINAIDWEKGCYVGQEITARMKYRALLKKSLTKISIIAGTVKPKDDIFFENNNIGYISSVNESIGLAMLRINDAKSAFSNDKILETKNGKIKVIFK